MEIKNGVLFNVTDKDVKILNANPEKFWKGVAGIGKDAFICCENLTVLSIPDHVTSIGDWAFANCENLTSISIPKSINRVGKWIFLGCENLKEVIVGDEHYDLSKSQNFSLDKLIARNNESNDESEINPLNP